jgi:hypothetical protein
MNTTQMHAFPPTSIFHSAIDVAVAYIFQEDLKYF